MHRKFAQITQKRTQFTKFTHLPHFFCSLNHFAKYPKILRNAMSRIPQAIRPNTIGISREVFQKVISEIKSLTKTVSESKYKKRKFQQIAKLQWPKSRFRFK